MIRCVKPWEYHVKSQDKKRRDELNTEYKVSLIDNETGAFECECHDYVNNFGRISLKEANRGKRGDFKHIFAVLEYRENNVNMEIML
jgi:hypothetical protein